MTVQKALELCNALVSRLGGILNFDNDQDKMVEGDGEERPDAFVILSSRSREQKTD